jgi:hypothetical protein
MARASESPGVASSAPVRSSLQRWAFFLFRGLAATVLVAGTISAAAFEAPPRLARLMFDTPPEVPGAQVFGAFYNITPIELTVTAEWTKIPLVVPAYQFQSDHTIWRRMYFDDWDRLPADVREPVLEAMMERYAYALAGPGSWARMDASDWDVVPQPLRAMAFVRMVDYWTRYYGFGGQHGLSERVLSNTASAIVMVESWFEHRAVQINRHGNRDLGLPQASDFARASLRRMYEAGWMEFALEDDDYFNPWHASRVAVVWLGLMLKEADGDLDLAVKAYHRGMRAAARGEGGDYLAWVARLRHRFIENNDSTPTWAFLFARSNQPAGLTPGRRADE